MKNRSPSYIRASISFPADIYQNLLILAKQKKVSLAWVVREAAERYVVDASPESKHALAKGSAPRGTSTKGAG